MALFKVDGWNLKTEKVAYSKGTSKKTERKNRNKRAESARIEVTEKQDESSRKRTVDDDQNAEEVETVEEKVEKARPVKKVKSEPKPALEVAPAVKKQLTPLQQKMMAKLTGSRFRWINEQLYTISSADALQLIEKQPELFKEYHEGFRSQVQSWPENPVDVFVDQIRERSGRPVNAPGGLPGLKDKSIVIADMGCGEAKLALNINNFFKKYNRENRKRQKHHKVHSFDLQKANDRITVADIKNVPLKDESCSIVVFCLALMGTNFLDFIKEAYRILAPNGELWIAEIKSRFNDHDGKGNEFVESLKLMGFFHKKTDDQNKMFTRFEFFKPSLDIIKEQKLKLERRQKFIEKETEKDVLQEKRQKSAEGNWLLKPCIYKRR